MTKSDVYKLDYSEKQSELLFSSHKYTEGIELERHKNVINLDFLN
jgi:hypothetical protein